MSVDGFEEHFARMEQAARAALPAAAVAVQAEVQRWYEASQETVPVGVDIVVRGETIHVAGTLKASGKVLELQFDGFKVIGGVSYGNADTVTNWHGIGYEVFVDQGTRKMHGRFYLTRVVMEATTGITARLGETFAASLREQMAA